MLRSNVHFGPPDGDWGTIPQMWNMMGPGMLLMSLFWFVFLVVLALAAVWLYSNLKPMPPAPSEDALEILKRRYAKGEIGKEEFDRIRQDIA